MEPCANRWASGVVGVASSPAASVGHQEVVPHAHGWTCAVVRRQHGVRESDSNVLHLELPCVRRRAQRLRGAHHRPVRAHLGAGGWHLGERTVVLRVVCADQLVATGEERRLRRCGCERRGELGSDATEDASTLLVAVGDGERQRGSTRGSGEQRGEAEEAGGEGEEGAERWWGCARWRCVRGSQARHEVAAAGEAKRHHPRLPSPRPPPCASGRKCVRGRMVLGNSARARGRRSPPKLSSPLLYPPSGRHGSVRGCS